MRNLDLSKSFPMVADAILMPRSGGRRSAAIACVAAALLSVTAASAQPRQLPRNLVLAEVADSRRMGALARNTQMNLAVGLAFRNPGELERVLEDISDPKSPNYRRYLTSEEFTSRFGPTERDYETLRTFFVENGFAVTATYPNRAVLDVTGPVSAIEKTFHVNMIAWQHAKRGTFFAPDREPSIDARVDILEVSGLDNFVQPRPMNIRSEPLSASRPNVGSGPNGLLLGKDFRAAYAPDVASTGTGQTIALFELDGFYPGDVTANFQAAGMTPVPVKTVLLNGFNGSPGGANIEVMLDIAMAGYMAPGASQILVYEGYNWNDILTRIATDNLASQISCSWSFSPISATAEQAFKQMIAQGQSFLQASGDSGAYSGWIMPPSDDPNVTVVGGTGLSTAGPAGAWVAEAAWGGSGGGVSTTYPIPSYQQSMNMPAIGGSATMRNIPDVAMTAAVQIYLIQNNGQAVSVGGTSAAAPLWAGFIALANQQAAANGAPAVGFLNPSIYSLGVTSNYATDMHDIVTGSNGYAAIPGFDLATGWGSPMGQHLIADLTVVSGPSFALSATPTSVSVVAGASVTSTVNAIASGGFTGSVSLSVSGLPAGVTAAVSQPGASGAGSVTLSAASSAAAGSSRFTVTGTSGSLTKTLSVPLTVTVPVAFTLSASVPSLTVLQGAAAVSTITLKPLTGFSGKVNLTASGLPGGVTASFSPASTATTSTLTLSAGAAATVGAATVVVTATSGNLVNSVAISLTVTGTPTFTISTPSPSLSVTPGAYTATPVTVSPLYGFTGKVSLSISGLPAGVTASFGALTAGGVSTLTLTASATAAANTATVQIAGSSGTLTVKIPLSIAVTAPPDFTFAPAASSLSVLQGTNGSAILATTPSNGFSGVVAFSISGLPTGVTAAFAPTGTAGSTMATFTLARSAVAGKFNLTLTATSKPLVHTAPLTLNVIAPVANSVPVNLSPVYNVSGLAIDFAPFTSGGLDALGRSYSGVLTGSSIVSGGAAFAIGPMNTLDAVSGISVNLPASKYSSLKVLATGVNGNQPSQKFVVSYSDGTSSSFTQSLSDWYTPQSYAGESTALAMPYRDNSTGTRDGRPFFLYQYSFSLTATKTVTSIALPTNRNVVVLAMTLTGGGSPVSTTQVDLSGAFDTTGITSDGNKFTGGLDGVGYSASGKLLASSQTAGGTAFNLGAPDAPNVVSGNAKAIALPAAAYSRLVMLAAAVNGSQASQTFKVIYSDGTSTTFTQSLSDWFIPQPFAGETKAVTMSYRNTSIGGKDSRTFQLYTYQFNLDPTKTLTSITLPNNRKVKLFAMTVLP